MAVQPLVTVTVACMSLRNNSKAVAHAQLVHGRGKQRGGHIDKHANGRVRVVRESLASPENGGDHARTEIPREVRAEGQAAEAPDHASVGEADDEGQAGWLDEGVRGVEGGPDGEADEGVGEELGSKDVAKSLVVVGHGRETRRWRTTADEGLASSYQFVGEVLKFGVIHADDKKGGGKATEDLREDVVGNLAPGEILPKGHGEGDGRVEVAARGGTTGDDGNGDADSKRPSDLEDGSEGSDAEVVGLVEGEAGDGGDAAEDKDEDTNRFSDAFPKPCRTSTLKPETPLRDGSIGGFRALQPSSRSVGQVGLCRSVIMIVVMAMAVAIVIDRCGDRRERYQGVSTVGPGEFPRRRRIERKVLHGIIHVWREVMVRW